MASRNKWFKIAWSLEAKLNSAINHPNRTVTFKFFIANKYTPKSSPGAWVQNVVFNVEFLWVPQNLKYCIWVSQDITLQYVTMSPWSNKHTMQFEASTSKFHQSFPHHHKYRADSTWWLPNHLPKCWKFPTKNWYIPTKQSGTPIEQSQ